MGVPPLGLDLAMQWTNSYVEQIGCYTNNIHNKDGGTHLTGLKSALTKTLNDYGQSHNLFRDLKGGLSGEDAREEIPPVERPGARGLDLPEQAVETLAAGSHSELYAPGETPRPVTHNPSTSTVQPSQTSPSPGPKVPTGSASATVQPSPSTRACTKNSGPCAIPRNSKR